MTKTIVVDAMGGDYAPNEIVKGAAEASMELPDVHLILVGDEKQISLQLTRFQHADSRIVIENATGVVAMDDKPAQALDERPTSSIMVATQLVRDGVGQALVSAGNTGASVLACAREWGLFPGVRRSGFAAVFPTATLHGDNQDPFSLMLDVGATINASAEDLVTWALMGSAYSKIISRNTRPTVALLSNGTEPNKGPPEIVEAHKRLRQLQSIHFIGNIEGLDIPKGSADVIVCSGFVGNVVLKMLEGVAGTVTDLAKYAYKKNLLWRGGLALLSGGIRRLQDLTDWQQYGGAPLLGFNDIMIKAHGRSKAHAITNAIKVADKTLTNDLYGLIATSMAELNQHSTKENPR